MELSAGSGARFRSALPALALASGALLLANLPRLALYRWGIPGQVFLGPVWGAWDAQVYYELLQDGASGSWLWTDRLDGPAHGAYFLYIPYLLAGHLFAPARLWPTAAYEASRWIAEPLALGAAWLYIRASLEPRLRLLGYFIALLAGGLGFLFLSRPDTVLGTVVPLDITDPNFSLLNSFQMAPHLALAAAGLALYAWGLLASAEGRRRGLWGAVGLGFVCTFHAFIAPMALTVGAAFVVWRARTAPALANLLLSAALCGPICLYWLYLKLTDHVLFVSQSGGDPWEFENALSLLVGRGVLWPLIAIGAWRALRGRELAPALALCWAAGSLAFNWFPPFAGVPLHRTIEGSSLAWGVLAAIGAAGLAARWRFYLVALACISPLLQAAAVVVEGANDRNLYISPDTRNAVAWIRDQQLQGRALASPATERLVVSLTDLYSDPATVPNDTRWITDPMLALPAAERSAWLRARGDTVVFWGAAEEARSGAPPEGLRVLHREGSVYLLGPE